MDVFYAACASANERRSESPWSMMVMTLSNMKSDCEQQDEQSQRRTRHGRAFRQRYQGQRWCPQSGGQRFLRAWHSTPTRICEEEGNYQRSRQAWLYDIAQQSQHFTGTFSASRSSPTREIGGGMVLTLAAAHALESRLVAKRVFARLDDESEPGRD